MIAQLTLRFFSRSRFFARSADKHMSRDYEGNNCKLAPRSVRNAVQIDRLDRIDRSPVGHECYWKNEINVM